MATQEAIFLKMLTREFNSEFNKAVRMFGDNQGSIALVKNPINHNRFKHIDIKFHFIREDYITGSCLQSGHVCRFDLFTFIFRHEFKGNCYELIN